MRKQVVLFLCTAAISLSAAASQSRPPTVRGVVLCRGNPSVVAPCFSFHGRMFLANGSPILRIWRVGKNRILGVLPSENPIVPLAIRKHLAFGVRIYANFEVCPYTAQKPGWMQMVCVQSASNVVIQNLRQDNKGPKIMKLPGTYALAPNNSIQRTQTRYAGSRR